MKELSVGEQPNKLVRAVLEVRTIVDRLLHHAVVVVTEGDSFRMREAKARRGILQKE